MEKTVQPLHLKYVAYAMTNNCLNHSSKCYHKENRSCPIHKLGNCDSVDVKDWILYLADEACLLIDINETQE